MVACKLRHGARVAGQEVGAVPVQLRERLKIDVPTLADEVLQLIILGERRARIEHLFRRDRRTLRQRIGNVLIESTHHIALVCCNGARICVRGACAGIGVRVQRVSRSAKLRSAKLSVRIEQTRFDIIDLICDIWSRFRDCRRAARRKNLLARSRAQRPVSVPARILHPKPCPAQRAQSQVLQD